jgi:GTP-binding protein HflX
MPTYDQSRREQERTHEVHTTRKAYVAMLARPGSDPGRALDELTDLARTAGLEVVGRHVQRRPSPVSATLVGKGTIEHITAEAKSNGAALVVFANDLTPVQQRNLERDMDLGVIDRTEVILAIFAKHAHTREGKLQVELAQLRYTLPRLTGIGSEMSRLGGGIGTRGPGETKLEIDRRRARDRIKTIEDELELVRRRRETQRRSRDKLGAYAASIVGYTSAGKSTLLNTLTSAEVFVDPMLFATLDPTTRALDLEDGAHVLLTDTVGFISDLPHGLIAAFRATLEEVTQADFLVHVVDASSPHIDAQMDAVAGVLGELGAADKPTVTVFNKIDLLDVTYPIRRRVAAMSDAVYVSALTGEGVEYLVSALGEVVSRLMVRIEAEIPASRSDLVALCHEHGRNVETEYDGDRVRVRGEIAPSVASRIREYILR